MYEGKKIDQDGKLIDKSIDNPILNTAVNNDETPNGHKYEYTANDMDENLYIHVEDYGYSCSMLYEIVGHRNTDDTILTERGYYETITGVKRTVINTK